MMEFRIRCSAIGTLMGGQVGLTEKKEQRMHELLDRDGDPNGKPLTSNMRIELDGLLETHKNPQLPQGAKTYVEKWLKEKLYGRRKEFSSKYTTKGNVMEDESIDFLATQLGYKMLIKNDEHYQDYGITGTPDIVIPDCVIDVKNSWDFSTFPLLDDEIPTDDYWWQGQGYMFLTGRIHYKLVYVLSDTPLHLIEREHRQYCYYNGYDVDGTELYNQFIDRMTYPDIDPKMKIKVFEFGYDTKAIEQVKQRVGLAQAYVNVLLNKLP